MVTSAKPHIVPAFYNWLSENDARVFITIVMEFPGVSIQPYPKEQFKDLVFSYGEGKTGKLTTLVLNTLPSAVKDFVMNEDGIFFSFRINGTVYHASIPYEAVLNMYCPDSELSQNFGLNLELVGLGESVEPDKAKVQEEAPPPKSRSHLQRIK